MTLRTRRGPAAPLAIVHSGLGLAALGLAAVTLAAGARPAVAAPPEPYGPYHSAVYAELANWVCHADAVDGCDGDLDATAVASDGGLTREAWTAAANPDFDCFYLYPTVSIDPGGNSDLVPGEAEEIFVTRQQAARLGSVCRVFAPVYRQVTLTALASALGGNPIPSDSGLADADVLDAWKHYVANHNHGRGVLLIGHSQGASRLITLLRGEIDARPALRNRLVSAMLLGTSFQVPVGADVGGQLASIPLCRTAQDTACVISYSSFRATAPPPANSRFGRSLQAGWQAACTNPAQLASGTSALQPYFPTSGRGLPLGPPPPVPPWVDAELGVTIDTPFVTLPGMLAAECRVDNGFSYLAITVNGDPDDARIDDIGGDLTPDWGLHLVDASVAMGDLVSIAAQQGEAFLAGRCAGDCDADGAVLIDELLTGVRGLLDAPAPLRCDALDRDRSGAVTVDELVTAIGNALSGC